MKEGKKNENAMLLEILEELKDIHHRVEHLEKTVQNTETHKTPKAPGQLDFFVDFN